MKRFFRVFAVLLLAALPSFRAGAQSGEATQPVRELLSRILPENGDADKFILVLDDTQTAGAKDFFTLSGGGQSVTVTANSNLSLATGINWYLQHYAGVDISWNAPAGRLPAELPAIAGAETHTTSADYRYYLNFCTHSYTMAFWGWDRWQQEIDWMALHGINLPLVITGMECVWKDMLQTGYGYDGLDGVNKFVTGSAYYGWFFMNNMTEWGGPQPESWYAQREELAKNIFRRLRDFGITPVIPGYVGMVPDNFLSYAKSNTENWKASDIVNGGSWNAFTRPYFVNNIDRLKEMAAAYYAAVDRVFGDVLDTHFYAIDPFHEGGVPSGVTNASGSVQAMWRALQTYDNEAVWVVQHWQGNPTTLVTHNIPLDRLLILDLHGESQADTQCSGQSTDASGARHQWVWCMLNNYGGNVGLFGRMERTLTTFNAAVEKGAQTNLKGIGAIPEGIENNSVLFDLLYAMPWRSEPYTLASWLQDYVKMRYGVSSETPAGQKLLSAWTRLAKTIYNCPSASQQGTTESVFMMRPNTKPGSVSTWAGSSWYWDFDEIRTAAFEFLDVSDELKDNANYQYDLVDLVRQCLADKGKELLDTYNTTDDKNALGETFLQMILDQDELLGTVSDFRLGRWTEMARALGTTATEKDLYEKNARMLVTTWGDQQQCDAGGLHDYGNREWNGLLRSYYYPRWKYFFDATREGRQLWPADGSWFKHYEWPFVNGDTQSAGYADTPEGAPYVYGSFSAEAEGHPVETAKKLFEKYFSGFKPLVWDLFRPDPDKLYFFYNVNKWYNAPYAEGVCVATPNSDYSAGYRLQRTVMNTKDDAYRWSFEPSAVTEGAYRIKNLAVSRTSYGPYLSSTPSSSAYPAFTLNSEGSDYFIFRQDDRFYIRDASEEIYFAPDCAWAAACILTSGSLSNTSYIRITDRDLSELGDLIQTAGDLLAKADDMLSRVGTGLYRYTDPDGQAAACRQTLAALIAGEASTAQDIDAAIEALSAALDAMTLNQPATNRFYRLAGKESGRTYRLSSVTKDNSAAGQLTLETADNTPTTVFYYTPEKQLISWANGLALGTFAGDTPPFAAAGGDGAAYTFGKSSTADAYTLVADGRHVLSHDGAAGTAGSAAGSADGTPDSSGRFDWTVEEVTWLPLLFPDNSDFATLYTPIPLEHRSRVTAYAAELLRDDRSATDYFVLHEVAGETLPALMPLLLEKGSSYTIDNVTRCVYLPVSYGASAAAAATALSGDIRTVPADAPGGHPYTLAAPGDEPTAFYKHNGATLEGFKAYYLSADGQASRLCFYREGEYTGIGRADAAQNSASRLFDLSGRSVSAPSQGIYITSEGRKIRVK